MDQTPLEFDKLRTELEARQAKVQAVETSSDKTALERAKLEAEIHDLQLKVRGHTRTFWLEVVKGIATYATIALSIAFWLISYFQQQQNQLDQQAREFEAKVSQELVTLIKELGGATEPVRITAAASLSTFGRAAIPPLRAALLDSSNPGPVQRTIIDSLATILLKTRDDIAGGTSVRTNTPQKAEVERAALQQDATVVGRALLTSASSRVTDELVRQQPDLDLVREYVTALVHIAPLVPPEHGFSAQLAREFRGWADDVRRSGLEKAEKDRLLALLDQKPPKPN